MTTPILMTFTLYLILMLGLGVIAYRRTHTLSDYVLGGRSLGSGVTALSASASDMSGWLLLGLPGAVYAYGLNQVWIAVGLLVGAYCNWRFVAKPLRMASLEANNALTVPDYLAERFQDKTQLLRFVSAWIILIFFTLYVSAGLVAGGKLFESTFELDYKVAVLVGASIIVLYTAVGGFLAVCWTDVVQGLLMLAALIIVPLAVLQTLGITESYAIIQQRSSDHLALWHDMSAISLVSLLAWGLGYFGQPHILARFMALRDPSHMVSARRIAMTWMSLALIGAVGTGLFGFAFLELPEGASETIFIELTHALFDPWVAGVILAALLSAIMSTIDSQLLVVSSSVTEDLYKSLVRQSASQFELVWVGRVAVVLVALCATWLALNPTSSILELVSYAWAGFGAAFGPVILFSLYWQRMTALAALCGMITGGVTVLLWSSWSGGWFDLYEIVPGILASSLAILAVSMGQACFAACQKESAENNYVR